MRLLLTSDTQAELNNLDLCTVSLKELLQAAKRYKPDAIIHCGDLKEQYSPVDVRVIKWWVRATKEITDRGYRFIVLMGNHDRISQAQTSKNWLDILKPAGAETVQIPMIKAIGDGKVSFLPFTSNKKQVLEWAKSECLRNESCPTALIFHLEVYGAKMGSITSQNGYSPDELFASDYDICLGGHLHEHQELDGGIIYVGSPFCHDWGECNQTKGNVIVDVAKGQCQLRQIPTKIPGWYDLAYFKNGFHPEPGAYIRCKVPVTSKKITDQLRAVEEKLKQKYPDCRYYVIPQLKDPEELEVALTGKTDKEKIEQYVTATWSEDYRFTPEQAVSYLAAKLKESGFEAMGQDIRFVKLTAKNVLCFQHIEIKYAKQGLVLLRGINKDWPGHSNGSGKTSCLSLLPVALFGQTLKGQKNDEWAREGTDDSAVVAVTFKDHQGGRAIIQRNRRPHLLNFSVNNEDRATGITGKGKNETQGQIEAVTGYDFQMLQNAVYIDQNVANGFVFGTQKDRMDLVGKLCNLERFEAALKLVTADLKQNQEVESELGNKAELLEDQIAGLREQLRELKGQKSTNWKIRAEVLRKKIQILAGEHAGLVGVKATYDEKQSQIDDLKADLRQTDDKLRALEVGINSAREQLKTGQTLVALKKCPVCEQEAEGVGEEFIMGASSELNMLEEESNGYARSERKLDEKIKRLETEIERYQDRVSGLETELTHDRDSLATIEQAASEEAIRNKKLSKKKSELLHKLHTARRVFKAVQSNQKELGIHWELYEYGKRAFSRKGMPLYLSAALCPVLNKAAEEYAEIFNQSKISIRFSVVDGEFTVSVINPSGSQTTGGQSVGESAMAGIVTAFALREVAPRTNLLILDEPGHGLDEFGARQFAKGLVKLKDRYETIIVTTHSNVIASVLEGECTVWTVEKRNGVSILLCPGNEI